MAIPELVPVLTQQEIHKKIMEVAGRVSEDYAGKDLLLIGILKGAFIFLSDLVRQMTIPVQIDFIRASSYGDNTSTSGDVKLSNPNQLDIRNKHVLLVEDIVDTGLTLSCIQKHFLSKAPASVKICTLIDKYERREVDIRIDYACHTTREGFLVGYGLDYAENYRGLPGIYHLKL